MLPISCSISWYLQFLYFLSSCIIQRVTTNSFSLTFCLVNSMLFSILQSLQDSILVSPHQKGKLHKSLMHDVLDEQTFPPFIRAMPTSFDHWLERQQQSCQQDRVELVKAFFYAHTRATCSLSLPCKKEAPTSGHTSTTQSKLELKDYY